MAFLYGGAGRLTAKKNGGFRPGQKESAMQGTYHEGDIAAAFEGQPQLPAVKALFGSQVPVRQTHRI
jgi:hypothetical protein